MSYLDMFHLVGWMALLVWPIVLVSQIAPENGGTRSFRWALIPLLEGGAGFV